MNSLSFTCKGGYATEKYEEPRRKSGIIFSKPKLRYRHKVYKCRLRSHRPSRTTDMVHFIDTNDDNSTSWLAPGVALGFLITVLIHLTYRVCMSLMSMVIVFKSVMCIVIICKSNVFLVIICWSI